MSSINAKQKKRGRPATGMDPMIGARFPSELTARIDAWASAHSTSRSEAIRRLVEQALAAPQSPKQPPGKMAPAPSAPPGMERDNHGNKIPLRKRTKDDQKKAKRAKR